MTMLSPIVASLAEAWIEISDFWMSASISAVASLAEAWIEIKTALPQSHWHRSPPSRRRGLKYAKCYAAESWNPVASLAEAWIEIE